MSKLVLNPEYQLYERSGQAKCSSLQVAEKFKKRHDNVLRDIEEKILGVASDEFTRLNFEVSNYLDTTGKRNKMYLMTKDGFLLLAMGFTGEKAMQWKIELIHQFNAMEAFIKSLTVSKLEHPRFTEAVMLAHDEPKHYHYSNEYDMINRIVLGCPAKTFLARHGLGKEGSIRPLLDGKQLAAVLALQMADVGFLELGMDFSERKAALIKFHEKRSALRLAA